jgi:hypothetical protein
MGTPGRENDRHRCTLLPHQLSDNPLRPISLFGEIGDFLGAKKLHLVTVSADRLYGCERFNLQHYRRAALPETSEREVHRSLAGAADSLTITSSNSASM